MALRASNGPTISTRSAKVGDVVTVTAKVENSGAGLAHVSCFVEDLKEGALGRPVPFSFLFDPLVVEVPGKSRRTVLFAWTAALPDGKDAFTFRGRLALKESESGRLVGDAPLDLYVSR